LTTTESPTIATWSGNASWGVGPRTIPATPAVPATVVTTPAGVILRSVWFSVSVTKTLPAGSTATPVGLWKRAAGPVPAAVPGGSAAPASVVTTPPDVILRITFAPKSAA